jgi:hypothetical protein
VRGIGCRRALQADDSKRHVWQEGNYETESGFGLWLPRAPLRNHGVLFWTARKYFSAIPGPRWQVFFDFTDLPERSYFEEYAESTRKSFFRKELGDYFPGARRRYSAA